MFPHAFEDRLVYAGLPGWRAILLPCVYMRDRNAQLIRFLHLLDHLGRADRHVWRHGLCGDHAGGTEVDEGFLHEGLKEGGAGWRLFWEWGIPNNFVRKFDDHGVWIVYFERGE